MSTIIDPRSQCPDRARNKVENRATRFRESEEKGRKLVGPRAIAGEKQSLLSSPWEPDQSRIRARALVPYSILQAMDEYLLPILGCVLAIAATYYYFVVLNKPKKLASVGAPTVKKGTAAAAKRRPKKKEEVQEEGRNPGVFAPHVILPILAACFVPRLSPLVLTPLAWKFHFVYYLVGGLRWPQHDSALLLSDGHSRGLCAKNGQRRKTVRIAYQGGGC